MPEKCLMGLRMMILNSKMMKLGKYFVIYHIYQGTAYAKCVILMFYSSIREDCLVVFLCVFFFGRCSSGVNFCLHFSGQDSRDRG